jgi:hypothetical protein
MCVDQLEKTVEVLDEDAALAGLFTIGTMSLTNFQLNSDFKWLLRILSLL